MRPHSALLLAVMLIVSGCGGLPEGGSTPATIDCESVPASDAGRAATPIIELTADADAQNRVLDPRADEVLRAMAA